MFVRTGVLAIAAGVFFAAGAASEAKGQAQGTPGKFDFYLLDLAAGTDFCHVPGIGGTCTPPHGYVLHGLWPQNNDGTYPVNCSKRVGPAHPERMLGVTPNLELVEHEWEKHGTCTKLSAARYFAAGRKAFEGIRVPAALKGATEPRTTGKVELLDLWQRTNPKLPPGSVVLGCNARGELTQVGLCFNKKLKPIACRNVRLCGEQKELTLLPFAAAAGP